VERVQRADVIAVGVGQGDAADRQLERVRGGDDVFGVAADAGVDQRQPVSFFDQITVHRKWEGLGELRSMSCETLRFHRVSCRLEGLA
jgi:hypothetical protein